MSAATHVHERGESEIAALWDEFKKTGDERAREGLILHYAPLVGSRATSTRRIWSPTAPSG